MKEKHILYCECPMPSYKWLLIKLKKFRLLRNLKADSSQFRKLVRMGQVILWRDYLSNVYRRRLED